jgi:hypothetical protein
LMVKKTRKITHWKWKSVRRSAGLLCKRKSIDGATS